MLTWKSTIDANGLNVCFGRRPVKLTFLVPPIVFLLSGSVLFYLCSLFSLETIPHAVLSLVLLIPVAVLVLVVVGSAIFTASELKQYSFSFSPTEIFVKTRYLGIPVKSQSFLKDEIYEFGYGHVPHTKTMLLGFAVNGDYFHMAYDVTEPEVNDFLQWLREQGMEYSSSREPVLRGNSAHTFLGPTTR